MRRPVSTHASHALVCSLAPRIFCVAREGGKHSAFVLSLAPFSSGGHPYWIALLVDVSTERPSAAPDEPPEATKAASSREDDLSASFVHKVPAAALPRRT